MACDLSRLREQERRAEERRREEALARLEADLASGIAQISVSATGEVLILGALPGGMTEACVLAALQRRDSQAFRDALNLAGVGVVDFITLHGHSH